MDLGLCTLGRLEPRRLLRLGPAPHRARIGAVSVDEEGRRAISSAANQLGREPESPGTITRKHEGAIVPVNSDRRDGCNGQRHTMQEVNVQLPA